MKYILPRPIKKGATIGIIALSGFVQDKEAVKCGIKNLENLGFKVKVSEHLFDKKRYLAGEDFNKIKELEDFFLNPQIDCILCARGGYGAIRLLDKINYDIIRQNPKAFCGYSDTTAISLMLLKRANLITYSAPMLIGDFGTEDFSTYTVENFLNAISGEKFEIDVIGDSSITCTGIAWGGNLSTLVSLCGREFLPEDDFIFFMEDINEPVYKIDRMLTQLQAISEFNKKIKGVVVGDFSGTNDKEILQEVLEEFATELKIPLWQGLKWGHEKDKTTIPIGKKCIIEYNKIKFNGLI